MWYVDMHIIHVFGDGRKQKRGKSNQQSRICTAFNFPRQQPSGARARSRQVMFSMWYKLYVQNSKMVVFIALFMRAKVATRPKKRTFRDFKTRPGESSRRPTALCAFVRYTVL